MLSLPTLDLNEKSMRIKKLKHSYWLKSLRVHIPNYSIFSLSDIVWCYSLSNTTVQIASYYQSFVVFCITSLIDLRRSNYCTFQGQFEGVSNTIKKTLFSEMFWSRFKAYEKETNLFQKTQKNDLWIKRGS